MMRQIQFSFIAFLIIQSHLSIAQDNTKSYLLLENDELKNKHIFKEKRKITVWINDTTSYSGFFTVHDSSFVILGDTSININSIVRLKGKNKRRSIGAPFVIITPILSGLALEVILLFYDDSFFNYFGVPTASGAGGSLVGLLTAIVFMEKKIYEIDAGDLKIVTVQ